MIGKAVFSPDETRLTQLAVGGFARFRERTSAFDRAVTITPVGDGSLTYVALNNGRTAPFDGAMQAWLSQFIPEVLREAGINVPERVARIRSQGGVSAVLDEIGRMRSSGAKSAHYQELIKSGPMLTAGETERLAQQAARDIKSSGDLSSVIQQLPKNSLRNPQTRQAVAGALSQIKSSGDRTNTLQVLAPNADPEMLVMLAKAAETLPIERRQGELPDDDGVGVPHAWDGCASQRVLQDSIDAAVEWRHGERPHFVRYRTGMHLPRSRSRSSRRARISCRAAMRRMSCFR